jgi:hypothetical protein
VVLDKSFGSPTVTKDGVTVAKEIELEDKFENMGAQMVKEVASKTSDVAGDGTTTATVLAQIIARLGVKNVTAGALWSHKPWRRISCIMQICCRLVMEKDVDMKSKLLALLLCVAFGSLILYWVDVG